MRNPIRPRRILLSLALVLPALVRAEDLRDVLKRQTQELADAVGSGNAAVWDKYLDAKVLFTDESGTVATKKEMVDR
jgi:hypothetical protein